MEEQLNLIGLANSWLQLSSVNFLEHEIKYLVSCRNSCL